MYKSVVKPVQVDLQVWIFKNSKFFNGKKDLLFVVNFWIPSSLKGSERWWEMVFSTVAQNPKESC